MSQKVPIVKLDTGVPGLNDVLGGGLPEFSFNLIAGGPGAGKTTLAQQMCFAMATPERPALYITVLGEPAVKVLRYQQQYAFFDTSKVNVSVRFTSIAHAVLQGGLGKVLEQIVADVEAANPSVVVVDSFRSTTGSGSVADMNQAMGLQAFVQRLALQLTAWHATTFLIGEYRVQDREQNPVFTVADGILWLYQPVEADVSIRKLQILKLRGQGALPGLHAFRITQRGIQIFPRLSAPQEAGEGDWVKDNMAGKPRSRVSTGIPQLDDLMGGGLLDQSSVLITGPAGSGKTVLATQFLVESANRGNPALLVVFEKRPSEYLKYSPFGEDVARHIRGGGLHVLYLHPLDLSVDEMLFELRAIVRTHSITRVVVDSVSGLEAAVAPGFQNDFRETLYRMVTMLTAMGITLLLTAELADSYTDVEFSPRGTAYLTDGIILQRYVELDGEMKRILTVFKMRGSAHSKQIRLYEITQDGIVIGEGLPGYEGLMTGTPRRFYSLPDND